MAFEVSMDDLYRNYKEDGLSTNMKTHDPDIYQPPPCTTEAEWLIRMEIDKTILKRIESITEPMYRRKLVFDEEVWKESNGYYNWLHNQEEIKKLYEPI